MEDACHRLTLDLLGATTLKYNFGAVQGAPPAAGCRPGRCGGAAPAPAPGGEEGWWLARALGRLLCAFSGPAVARRRSGQRSPCARRPGRQRGRRRSLQRRRSRWRRV